MRMNTLVYTCTECGTETRELARDVGVPEHHVGATVQRRCLSPEEAITDDRTDGCGTSTEMVFEGMVPTGSGSETPVSNAICPLCRGKCKYEGEKRDRDTQDIKLPPRDAYDGFTLWAALEAADDR